LGALDLAAGLRMTPGIQISRYNEVGSYNGNAGGAVHIRGMGASRPGSEIKTYLDGVPLYMGIWNHPLMDLLPINGIQSIDVYKSAQPQVNGNNFGSINLTSKRANVEGVVGESNFSAGSFSTRTANANLVGKKDDVDYSIAAGYISSAGDRSNSDGNLKNVYYELFGQETKAIKRLNHDVTNTDISFVERNDFVIQGNDDPYATSKLTNFTNTRKKHYTSINSSILEETVSAKTDFTLYRIKLNIQLDGSNTFREIDNLSSRNSEMNVIGVCDTIMIPSEILDVTIAGFYDTGRRNIITPLSHLDERGFTLTGNQYNLFIYSVSNHVNDLIHVLFKQRGYIPWTDAKYVKRLERLLLFIAIKIKLLNPNEKDEFVKMIKTFIKMKNHITLVNRGPPPIYKINRESLLKSSDGLLEFITNKDDATFSRIYEKYIDDNFPEKLLNTYRIGNEKNYFEKIINFIVIWSRILLVEEEKGAGFFSSSSKITKDIRSNLIKKIYKDNNIFVAYNGGIEKQFFILKTEQCYYNFVYSFCSRLQDFLPFIESSN
jgi:hypothetical protein